jgi:hypothetical protein
MAVKSFTFMARSVDGVSAESGALTTVRRKNTTTKIVVYTDSDLTVPAANPQVASSLGLVGPLYWNDSTEAEVTFTVATSDGGTTLLQVDYSGGVFTASYAQVGQLTLFEETATGDGSDTTFVLSDVVASSPYQMDVTIDGLLQNKGSYTVSTDGTDTTVTFTEAPPDDAVIYFTASTLAALSPSDQSSAVVLPQGGTDDETLALWLARPAIRVRSCGALTDGSDARPGIAAAIALAVSSGVNAIECEPGTYTFLTAADSSYCISLPEVENFFIGGQGRKQTVWKVDSSISRGVMATADGCNGLKVRGVTFDGNRQNTTAAGLHALRLGEADDVELDGVGFINANAYGLGAQAGHYRGLKITNFYVANCNLDGIDIKNFDDLNERIIISGGTASNNGQDLSASAPAAIDIRGPGSLVSNVHTYLTTASLTGSGIRLRQDDGTQGLGGKYSQVTNCHHYGTTGTYGFYSAAPRAAFTACSVYMAGGTGNCFFFSVDATDDTVANCIAVDGGRGFWSQAARVHFTSCAAFDHSNEGWRIDAANDNTFLACHSNDNAYGFRQINSSTGSDFRVCQTSGNSTLNWSAVAGNYKATHCIGIVTQNAGGASGTTDGSGDLTVTHGLVSTPTRVMVTVTGTTYAHAQVHTIGSTTFKIRFFDAAGVALATTSLTADWDARNAAAIAA